MTKPITLVHDDGATRQVHFLSIAMEEDANGFLQVRALVQWPLNGVFALNLETGRIEPTEEQNRAVAQWRADEPSLVLLREQLRARLAEWLTEVA